jgi:hypothetical protein
LQIANCKSGICFVDKARARLAWSVFHPCFIRGYLLLASLLGGTALFADEPKQSVLVVVGAEGSPEFAPQFRAWAEKWQAAAEHGKADCAAIGLEATAGKPDRDLLRERIAAWAGAVSQPAWLVLIGHGTFDGKTARFNLRGDDISADELAQWLAPVERPLAVINCASSSGPFLAALSGPQRAVITAARSGHEVNFARFGEHLAASIGELSADLDKDEQTSLLEAFLAASAKTREFYASEGRLATEHSLLDDNGDKLGTPGDWFQGNRATKSAKDGAALDGQLAGQFVLVTSSREQLLPESLRVRRDELESQLASLRKRKSELSEAEYFKELEPLLVELARLYP